MLRDEKSETDVSLKNKYLRDQVSISKECLIYALFMSVNLLVVRIMGDDCFRCVGRLVCKFVRRHGFPRGVSELSCH